MSDIDLALRVLTGMLCGLVIGFERARDHKNTGMRTLGLVGLGASLLVGAVQYASEGAFDSTSRVIQGMLAGIGFLGAGVILHNWRGDRTHGMTTAAAIWVTAILGMVAGIGQMIAALIGAVAVFVLLLAGRGIDRAVERWFGEHDGQDNEPR